MNAVPLYTTGRALMALLFLVAGIRKAMAYAGTVSFFTTLGLPMPEVVAPLVMAIEIGGGLALLIGLQTRAVAAMLALFTLGSALIGHKFWAADAAQFNAQLNNFLKNIAIVGGFLVMIALENVRQGVVTSVEARRV
jgi:putative oxidoreductase